MLESIINETAANITPIHMMVCSLASLGLGLVLAGVHSYKNSSSRSFMLALVLLPFIVQIVIMMVNGNLGTGVAVMGAFSLVRFRSLPGNAREITSVFLAMAIGLANGMGYIGASVILIAAASAVTLIFLQVPDRSGGALQRELKITISENLDYTGIFDDIFLKYVRNPELVRVKTVNMGSLYELCYRMELKSPELEKMMLDEIRCRNGNLTVICGRVDWGTDNL